MDVSVCIVSYKRKELLAACIDSLKATTRRVAYEVIVVDNASGDGTVEYMRAHYPDVRLIANTENRGFGAANNQAIEVAQGRYCLLLNNDTLALDGALDTLCAYLDAHPDTGILGCRMYADVERTQMHRTCYNRYPTLFNSFLHQFATLLRLRRYPEHPITRFFQMGMAMSLHEREQEPEHINGACMLCRRDALLAVNGFDERFFLFLEETDLCKRIRRAGWKIRYTPDAAIVHLGSQSLILVGKYKEFHYASKCWFLEKHYGKLHAQLYKWEIALFQRLAPRLLNQDYQL